jgi:hypothetical protein
VKGKLVKDSPDIFKKIYVMLYSDNFKIPQGIVNHYSIRERDALVCNLLELSDLQKKIKKVDKDVLVDIKEGERKEFWCDLRGLFSEGDCYLYEIKDYQYALLEIKEIIKSQ